MTLDTDRRRVRGDDTRPGPGAPSSVERTGAYEEEDGVVFYDAEEPLAWLQSDRTCRLADRR
jgi:hypothetical protein